MHRNLSYRNSSRDKLNVADKGLPIKQLTGGERATWSGASLPLASRGCQHESLSSRND